MIILENTICMLYKRKYYYSLAWTIVGFKNNKFIPNFHSDILQKLLHHNISLPYGDTNLSSFNKSS